MVFQSICLPSSTRIEWEFNAGNALRSVYINSKGGGGGCKTNRVLSILKDGRGGFVKCV